MLSKAHFQIVGKSLIELHAIDFQTIPDTNWIFFYSKNAITFFFENIEKQSFSLDKKAFKWATIGEGTAKRLLKYNIKADFIGNGTPDKTAFQFLRQVKKQTVTFPRATTSQKSIQKILADQIQAIDLLVYKNQPIQNIKSRNEAFLVFTSPMNATAYFEKHPLKNQQQLIAIGQTTAKALKNLGFNNIIISKTPSEKGLAEAVLSCGF